MTSKTSALRTRWAAVGAAVAVTLGAAGLGGLNIASADISNGDRPVFVSINPCRLVDTRSDQAVGPKTGPLGPGETLSVVAHGSNGECTGASAVPTDALSLSLNVTAVRPTADTFLTFWGDGTNPGTSNLNPRAGGAPTPNSVNTPLSTTGTFNIFNNLGNVDVIVDVNGFYANHNHDDQYAQLEHDHDDLYDQAPDRVSVSGRDFRPESLPTDWEYTFVWARSAGTSECLVAPVQLAGGRTIDAINVTHLAQGAAQFDVLIAGSRVESGTGLGLGDFVHLVVEDTVDVTATAVGELAEVPVDIADATVRADHSYSVIVCSDDQVGMAGVIFDLS